MEISNLLCDLYDIREMAEYHEFGQLPKDLDGTDITIKDLLDDAIQELEKLSEEPKEETCLNCGDVADEISPEDNIRYCLECLNDPKV